MTPLCRCQWSIQDIQRKFYNEEITMWQLCQHLILKEWSQPKSVSYLQGSPWTQSFKPKICGCLFSKKWIPSYHWIFRGIYNSTPPHLWVTLGLENFFTWNLWSTKLVIYIELLSQWVIRQQNILNVKMQK